VDKKYIIVFIVAVAAAGGFFIFNHQKNEKDLQTHESNQYKRLIEAANKSSFAGLSHMGRALNKYREEKGTYPKKLSALYPDYIPSKAFINNIQWQYERQGKDFYLRKTIDVGKNKMMTAAIRSDLKPIQDTMVAFTKKQERPPVATKPKPIIEIAAAGIAIVSEKKPKLIEKIEVPVSAASNHKTDILHETPIKSIKQINEPKSFSIAELNEKEQFINRVKGGFLVWKNDDGTLGFGNVEYPISEKMTIYDEGKWFQIHRQGSNQESGMTARKAQKEKAAAEDRMVASGSI
jgi:hypothetical protein